MAIDLDKQYGPFSLKIWLVIGIVGIGAGLYLAKRMGGSTVVSSGAGKPLAPPPIIFSKVIIGIEHVPGIDTQAVPKIKPEPVMPLMTTGYLAPHTPYRTDAQAAKIAKMSPGKIDKYLKLPVNISPAQSMLPSSRNSTGPSEYDLGRNAYLHSIGVEYVPTPGNTTLTGGYFQKIP